MNNSLILKVKNSRGFTLIELMIVIGIIGILAVIAIPQYTSYIARAQLTEAINILDGAKKAALDYKMNYGTYPGANTLAQTYPVLYSLSSSTKYIQTMNTVTVSSGSTQLRYTINMILKTNISSLIAGKTIGITITPTESLWACTTDIQHTDVLPSTC